MIRCSSGCMLVAGAQDRLLHVVDRLLAGQHAVEEAERDEPRGQRQDRADGAEEAAAAGDVLAGAVHELLEHLGVVALLGRLVRGVAELRRAVGQP